MACNLNDVDFLKLRSDVIQFVTKIEIQTEVGCPCDSSSPKLNALSSFADIADAESYINCTHCGAIRKYFETTQNIWSHDNTDCC